LATRAATLLRPALFDFAFPALLFTSMLLESASRRESLQRGYAKLGIGAQPDHSARRHSTMGDGAKK
jgi:hypothetical protein